MPKPVLQSLILADHVYEDKLTGKRIIAGVFNRIIRGVKVLKQMPQPGPSSPPLMNPPAGAPSPAIHFSQPGQANQPAPAPFTPAAPPPAASSPAVPEPYSAPPEPAAAPPAAAPYEPPPAATPPAVSISAPQAPATAPASTPPAAAPAPAAYPTSVPQQATPPQPAPPPPQPTPPPHAPHQPPQQHFPPQNPNERVLEIPPTGLQSGSPFAYLSLTEVRGNTPFLLQLVNLEDDTQLFRSELRVDCPNPLYTVELTVPLPPISPPQAGIYALELLYQNEILGSLRIVVEDAA